MKKKTMLVVGILVMALAVGAMSLAMAQNQSISKDIQNHECTPEMMGDMSKKCPEQMMQTGAPENMMNATNKSSMMGHEPAGNAETTGADHCGSANSDMGSMMGSGATANAMM